MRKFFYLIALAALCSCTKQETDVQRWERQARALMPQECSNEVVGISHIINSELVQRNESPGSWSGRATVDYVNRNGGIDRTNLFIAFRVSGGDLYALPDFKAYQVMEKARYDAEMEIITNRANAALHDLTNQVSPK